MDPHAVFDLIKNGDEPTLTKCLEDDPTLANREIFNASPLHLAIVFMRIGMVKILIAHKADLNYVYISPDKKRHPLLFSALTHPLFHQGQLTMMLIEAGANVNITDHNNDTPLHLAKEPSVIKILIERGANINAINLKGQTPLHCLAISDYNNKGLEVLLKAKANPNLKDNKGDTPLHRAGYYMANQNIAFLLYYGADPSLTDSQGLTIRDISTNLNNKEALSILDDYDKYK